MSALAVLPAAEPCAPGGTCSPLPLHAAAAKTAAADVRITANDASFMDEVVASVHRVVATPLYQKTALATAPAIARLAPQRVQGLFSSFDFHMTPGGPRLIEINTNAGGAFYGALIDEIRWRAGEHDARPFGSWAHLFVQHVRHEWSLAGRGRLRTIAIVDDNPAEQFLRLEFETAARIFRDAGIDALIADPAELTFRDGRLWRGETSIDLVYNRLTSFSLARDVDRPLFEALSEGAAVVTPDPRTHALLSCKRNLVLLSDDAFLREASVDPSAHGVLLRALPRTELLSPESAGRLWNARDHYYFKPAAGFGSRAVYDGAKLTAKTWGEISAHGEYVAQQRVEPRRVAVESGPEMRFDVRTFAYGPQPFMRLARVYRGQTTNFRTPGGGFAPVRIQTLGPAHQERRLAASEAPAA